MPSDCQSRRLSASGHVSLLNNGNKILEYVSLKDFHLFSVISGKMRKIIWCAQKAEISFASRVAVYINIIANKITNIIAQKI